MWDIRSEKVEKITTGLGTMVSTICKSNKRDETKFPEGKAIPMTQWKPLIIR